MNIIFLSAGKVNKLSDFLKYFEYNKNGLSFFVYCPKLFLKLSIIKPLYGKNHKGVRLVYFTNSSTNSTGTYVFVDSNKAGATLKWRIALL